MRRTIFLCALLVWLPAVASASDDLPDWAICTAEDLRDISAAQDWDPMRIGDGLGYSHETIEALPYLPHGHWRYAVNGSSDWTLTWGGPVLVAELGVEKHTNTSTPQLYVTNLHLVRGKAFRRRSYFDVDQQLDTLDINQVESFRCGIDPVLWVPAVSVFVVAAAVAVRFIVKRKVCKTPFQSAL